MKIVWISLLTLISFPLNNAFAGDGTSDYKYGGTERDVDSIFNGKKIPPN